MSLRGPCCCLLLLVAACLGCGDKNVGTVSGNVLIDGEPPEKGAIIFASADGKTGPAGTNIVDGAYTAELPIGEKKIQVRVSKVVGQKRIYEMDENSPIQDIEAEVLPPWYNDETELLYTVVPGEQTHDLLELSTSRKRKK